MIDPNLFAEPVALDREKHRGLRVRSGGPDFARTAAMNALFITAVEFGDVCKDYAIVFVGAGTNPDGKADVAPMAVLGLAPGENLMLQADGSWAAHYVPAMLRAYPLGLARVDDKSYTLCIDAQSTLLSSDQGQALFTIDGQPSPFLDESRRFLEQLEAEVQRTRLLCQRLLELELLQNMRFDATLPDGSKVSAEGFFAIDEKKLAELPDATVVELHRNGMLGLVHAQQISMSHMRRLVERRVERAAPVLA